MNSTHSRSNTLTEHSRGDSAGVRTRLEAGCASGVHLRDDTAKLAHLAPRIMTANTIHVLTAERQPAQLNSQGG